MKTKKEVEKLVKMVNYQGGIELPYGIITRVQNDSTIIGDCRIIWNKLNFNPKGKTVLDVGCNVGFYSIKSKQLGAREVVGFDASLESINIAKEIREVLNLDIKFAMYNFFDFDWKFYDAILCLQVIYHIKNPQEALNVMTKNCKELVMYTQIKKEELKPEWGLESYSYVPYKEELIADLENRNFKIVFFGDVPEPFGKTVIRAIAK